MGGNLGESQNAVTSTGMSLRFDDFVFDKDRFELSRNGEIQHAEPKVLQVLSYLIDNRHRLVTKDELVQNLWDGRAISDWTLTGSVKSARHLLGDNAKQKRYIKTIHGKGFRFVCDVEELKPVAVASANRNNEREALSPLVSQRPSIAVLPFRLVGVAGPYAHFAEALPHELITEMARLRWLFVIARGSSFRFHSRRADLSEIGNALGVRYCITGSTEVFGDNMVVSVELANTRDNGIIWAERFGEKVDAVHDVRRRIITEIITALEIQIPMNEARSARLRSPHNLDAWAVYHLGIEQMFKFTAEGAEKAIGHFEQAAQKEPDFARAYAGQSFAHFQDAFLGQSKDRSLSVQAAIRNAELALERDPLDPFANLVKGRSFWLEHDMGASLEWLDRTVRLSPCYAQGQYSKSWVELALGRVDEAIADSDLAMRLSPLDPMLSPMCGVKAGAHFTIGQYDQAAKWAEKGASAPGSQGVILALTAAYHQLDGNVERARYWAEKTQTQSPELSKTALLQSLSFTDDNLRDILGDAFTELKF